MVVWAKCLGDSGGGGRGIEFGPEGNLFVAGYGGGKMQVQHIDAETGDLIWQKRYATGQARDIKLAPDNTLVVAAFGEGNADFGDLNLTSGSSNNPYLFKILPNGRVAWAETLVGNGDNKALSLAFTPKGDIFLGGWYSSTLTTDAGDQVSRGSTDAFIARYTDTGHTYTLVEGRGDDDNSRFGIIDSKLYGIPDSVTGNSGQSLVDGLVAYWAFEGLNEDGRVQDLSSNSHDATLVGNASFSLGRFGQAINLDGNGDYLQAPSFTGIHGTQARTVSMWMKTEARDAALLSWGSSGGGQKWTFRTQSTNGVSGALRTEVSGGHVVGSTLVADGNWHHVVAVLPQGSSNVSQVLLYVDGFLETTSSTDSSSINTSNSSAVKIGSDFSARHFQGSIDEVAIFDRALNGFEIEALSLTTPANGTFDYEAQSTFSVRVRSTDSAGEYVEQDFEITLEDEDEPPTGITLDSNLVPENSPKGTVVGLFAAIDQDIGDRHKFTLVEGEGDGDNANFSISGNSLKTVLPFDYEFQRSHTIRVRAEDSAKVGF